MEAQPVMEWVRTSHESLTGRDGYADFYKKDIQCYMLGPVGDKIEQWTLKEAFIQSSLTLMMLIGKIFTDPPDISLTLFYDYINTRILILIIFLKKKVLLVRTFFMLSYSNFLKSIYLYKTIKIKVYAKLRFSYRSDITPITR